MTPARLLPLLRALLIYSCMLGLPGKSSAAGEPEARTLNFGPRSSIARVMIRDAGSTDERDWKSLSEATGAVAIPAGKEVMLNVYGYVKDFTPLDALGPDDLREINMNYGTFPEGQLAHLKNLTGLKRLDLGYSSVTDGELVNLAGLTSLKVLDLVGTKVTDAGLASLKGLPALEDLSLQQTNVGNDGMDSLREIKTLKRLCLWFTNVTEPGYRKLKELPLEMMNFNGGLDDAALADLGQVPSLEEIYAPNNHLISDAGLAGLGNLPKLKVVVIRSNRITDAGLMTLSAIPTLETVFIIDGKLTSEGIEQFRQKLPNCRVYR